MASTRRDDLAKRLAARLDQAPPKGRAMSASVTEIGAPPSKQQPSKVAPSKKATSTRPTQKRRVPKGAGRKPPARSRATAMPESTMQHVELLAERPRRGSTGTVLRGHLVPETIHCDARWRKATLRATTGVRITWDDVMCDGVALLVAAPDRAQAMIDDVQRSAGPAGRRRLVQATMPAELDLRLVELHLGLADHPEASLTFEQLWASAILLWLESSDGLIES